MRAEVVAVALSGTHTFTKSQTRAIRLIADHGIELPAGPHRRLAVV